MNERLSHWAQLAKSRILAMSPTERLRMGAVVVLGVVALSVGVGWITRTNWQPLYTHLAPQAAGQITNQLTQMKVPYQLTDQGRTVLVPQNAVDQVRVDLANRNIPSKGTVGMPAPLSFSLGETNQEIQMQQMVNLEAVLEQTINSIKGVKSSRVTINEPPPALFGQGSSAPTAAIFVDLNPGATLSPAAVKGIMNLVAHSVSGLSVKSVAVVDQNGTELSTAALQEGSSGVSGQTAGELSAQQAVQNQVAASVSSMLDQVLGPGHAVVRVHAALNFASATVKNIVYGNKVLSQQQVTQNKSSGTGAPLTQTGAGGNVPSYPTVGSGGSQSSSNQNSTINKYLVSQKETSQTIPPGAISRMTVAVAVDQSLGAAQKANLQQLVSQAAGINATRGDQVYIMAQPFNHQLVHQALAQMAQAKRALQLRREVEAGMALLAAIGLVFLFRRLLAQSSRREALPGSRLSDTATLTVDEVLASSAAPPQADGGRRPIKELDMPRQHLTTLLKREPETVADILRSWMDEDE